MSKEEYARKRIYNGCLVQTENPVTWQSSWCPNSYPRDGIFNPPLKILIISVYIPSVLSPFPLIRLHKFKSRHCLSSYARELEAHWAISVGQLGYFCKAVNICDGCINNDMSLYSFCTLVPESLGLTSSRAMRCSKAWNGNKIWAAIWQNQQSDCAPSRNSDQPGHLPSLIRVFAVGMKKAWVLSYPLSAQRRLIRCPGWSESSLGVQSLCWFCHVVAQIFIIT